MSTNAPESRPQARRATEREQVWLDARKIHSEAPGTVCVRLRHYQSGRHLVPYRMGYVHHYQEEAQHWHSSETERNQCRDAEQSQ